MNYLIITFDGFGDGVIYYPIFKEIGEKRPDSLFFCTPNKFLSDKSTGGMAPVPKNLVLVNEDYRKFPKSSWEEITGFLHSNNIRTIINLRTIGRVFEPGYYYFKDRAAHQNVQIAFFDDEVLKNEEKIDNNIRDIVLRITEKGIKEKLTGHAKLFDKLQLMEKKSDYILINMHSRGAFKSWEHGKWAGLITALVSIGKKIRIYEGHGTSENLYTEKVLDLVSPPIKEKLIVVSAANFRDLANVLLGSSVVVSVDSGIIHLADSLGISSLGIYLTTSPLMWGGVTDKFHYVASPHQLSCKNYFPAFGMCMNGKQKCKDISDGRDDIDTGFVIEKVAGICDEKNS